MPPASHISTSRTAPQLRDEELFAKIVRQLDRAGRAASHGDEKKTLEALTELFRLLPSDFQINKIEPKTGLLSGVLMEARAKVQGMLSKLGHNDSFEDAHREGLPITSVRNNLALVRRIFIPSLPKRDSAWRVDNVVRADQF